MDALIELYTNYYGRRAIAAPNRNAKFVPVCAPRIIPVNCERGECDPRSWRGQTQVSSCDSRLIHFASHQRGAKSLLYERCAALMALFYVLHDLGLLSRNSSTLRPPRMVFTPANHAFSLASTLIIFLSSSSLSYATECGNSAFGAVNATGSIQFPGFEFR